MASTLKHLRSSTADKRPTASGLADGQLAINTASGTPGLFFKDSNGGVVKVGPTHVGTSAPNAVPAGAAGNAKGELWVDENTTTPGLKYYSGSAFVNLTPSGTTDTIGLVELATPAETQAGSDGARAVTPSGLQSKISNSISTTSSTTIASSTAVKTAYDLANAALPKTGGTVAGEILISPSGSLAFEGSSDDTFQTTLAVTNPTADRTITFPNITGTVITTGDTSTVTSTMIADNTIVNADINASAAIAFSKLATGALPSGITVNSSNIVDGSIVNANISASAEIAVSKLANGAARQLLQTDAAGTGVEWASNIDIPGTLDVASAATFDSTISIPLASSGSPSLAFTGDPNTGIYSPGADQLAVATNGMGRLFVDASGNVGVGTILPEVNVDVASNVPTIQWRDLNGPANANRYRIGIDASQDFVFQAVTDAGVGGGSLWRFTRNGSEIENLIGNRAGTERLRLSNHDNKITFSNALGVLGTATAHDLQVLTNNAERARIDSGGRLLVGTSAARAVAGNFGSSTNQILFETVDVASFTAISNKAADAGPVIALGKSRGGVIGSTTAVQSDDILGSIKFAGANGTDLSNVGAEIAAHVDGAPFTSGDTTDLPGRLIFCTTADGAAIPTERMRIDSAGQIKAASLGTAAAPVWSFTGDPNTGIYSPGADQVAISTGGTGRVFIDGNGAVGIGRTTEGFGRFELSAIAYTTNASANGYFLKGQNNSLVSTSGWVAGLTLESDATGLPIVSIKSPGVETANAQTTINAFRVASAGASQFLTFHSGGGNERARIDSSGRLLVGATAIETFFDGTLNVAGRIHQKTNGSMYIWHTGTTGTRNLVEFGTGSSYTTVGTISTTGSSTSYNTTSDYRLKENVAPVDDSITRLQQLKPSRFNFIADPDTVVDGFIAHEAAEVVPECVTGTKDAVDDDGKPVYQGIDQSKLVPLLTAALQEAITKIETLEARLTAAGIE